MIGTLAILQNNGWLTAAVCVVSIVLSLGALSAHLGPRRSP